VDTVKFTLRASSNADRTESFALTDATTSENLYVFLDFTDPVASVAFYLDNATATGDADQVSEEAPYDFSGTTSDSTAFPFDTTSIPNGDHTITAVVTEPSGSQTTLTSSFVVTNTQTTEPVVACKPIGSLEI